MFRSLPLHTDWLHLGAAVPAVSLDPLIVSECCDQVISVVLVVLLIDPEVTSIQDCLLVDHPKHRSDH